jgi:hypothetical protein
MQRSLTGLVLAALFMTGCAIRPGSAENRHVPCAGTRLFAWRLDSSVFRGALTMTEQCDANGGTR